jgi:ParB family chromosome partitioning protein
MNMSTMQSNKSVLGKGLASLLPGVAAGSPEGAVSAGMPSAVMEPAGLNRDRHPGIAVLDIQDIRANEFQPRRDFDPASLEELAQSIRENGLIQPLVVRKTASGYELIAGERRLRASKLAGLKMVPVVIRKSTDRESLELAIVENIQREDLNCVDEGLAYFQLMQEFQLSQEELAKRMGKDRATIANALRVLKLSDTILVELKKGTLSRGHAKALLSIEDAAERDRLAKEILETGMSVRQAEKSAQEKKAAGQAKAAAGGPAGAVTARIDPELMKLTQDLTRRYMSKVEIKGSKKSGQIVIKYASKDELARIFGRLMGE